ncbi:MAG: NAD(P)-binding domain-containing protein [Nitrosomonadaceae bacterium]
MSDITVVGLGLMGTALANALLSAGHDITVWNRTRGKMEPLVSAGARGARSLGDAMQMSPVVLISVSNYEMTFQLFGTDETVGYLDGRSVVQLSSGTPGEAADSETWFIDKGAAYLDGAILGGPAGIGKDTAQILICGNETCSNGCEPVLRCLAGRLQYLGENIRAAATLDMAWLAQRYGIFVSTAHALLLCEAEGVSADLFAKTVAGGRAREFAEIVHSGDFSQPSATLNVWNVANEHIRIHAQDMKINTEFPDFVSKLLTRAEDAGYGDEDIAAIVKLLRS